MRYLVAIIFFCILSGCSVASLNKNVIHLEPYNNVEKNSSTISVKKLIYTADTSKSIGKCYKGLTCMPCAVGMYVNVSNIDDMLSTLSNSVRNKLATYGYSLLGEEKSLFIEELSEQSEYILGGKIIGYEMNACSSIHGVKGEAYFNVEWAVFDNRTKKIVLTLTTEGFSSANEFIKSEKAFVIAAFDMAIDNLLAATEFYSLLTKRK